MARLIHRLTTETRVHHGSFDLLDEGGPRSLPQPANAPGGGLLRAADNTITALSATPGVHYAAVDLEVWDGEPPPADGAWHPAGNATLRLSSGEVEVNPLVEGDDTEMLIIGPPGTYALRASVITRSAPNGVERWLFQFWPARS
ncbi:MAG: hypothetical protein GEV11_13210 [Streptosporangiales bacterium]|nr:hypothetical protein [Streptosporangiales bacterium]